MSGTVGEGVQYRLKVDSARTSIMRHHILTYTGTDEGVDVHDGEATEYIFAGVVYTSWPYQEQAALYAATAPYAGTNLSVPPTDEYITVARNSRNHVIPAETVAAGNLVMPCDVADHTAGTDTHDGMISPVATGTAAEVDQAIGFAETGFTVPGTNDVHADYWDWDYGHYDTVHEAVWAYIFK